MCYGFNFTNDYDETLGPGIESLFTQQVRLP